MHDLARRRALFSLLCLSALLILGLFLPQGSSSEGGRPLGRWSRAAENPVLSPGKPGTWDSFRIYAPTVLIEDGIYKMWYTGWDSLDFWRIGYATSHDGLHWEKYADNPVLNVGAYFRWDGRRIAHPTVIHHGRLYEMWYAGCDQSGHWAIGYAISNDGITWAKYKDNPVLTPGPAGSWDEAAVREPTVIYRDGTYHLWYVGKKGYTSDEPEAIGYATSEDGIHWTKHPGPVLTAGPAGSWEYPHVFGPSVLYDAERNLYRMWYISFNQEGADPSNRVGQATSEDGITWQKLAGNPVFGPSATPEAWDSYDLFTPFVLREDDTYRMWYTGVDQEGVYRIGYADAPVYWQVFLPLARGGAGSAPTPEPTIPPPTILAPTLPAPTLSPPTVPAPQSPESQPRPLR